MATVEQVLAAARAEIGYTESPPGSNRTKFAAEANHINGQPWCATFQVAIAKRVGLQLPSTSPYTPTMANGFKSDGRWSVSPSIGAFAFFDFPDSKYRIQHVGVVESFDTSTITTIDGNTSSTSADSEDNGGGVFRRRRSRKYVVGYGLPAYVSNSTEEERMFTVTLDGKTFQFSDILVHEPTGGYWGLEPHGGIISVKGPGGSLPPFHGSHPKGREEGWRAIKLEPFKGGYMFVNDRGETYHYPDPNSAPAGISAPVDEAAIVTKAVAETLAEIDRRLEN